MPTRSRASKLEVLASAGMALGDVSGTQGVDLSTPAALLATSVGSSAGSAEVFAGSSVSLGLGSGSLSAYGDLSVSSRGAISASQLTTTTGNITVATQSGYAVAADAGGDLSVVALGSINEAAYSAGRDATLISLGDIHTNTAQVDAGRALRLLAKGNIDADNATADTIALLHAEGNLSGDFTATTEIDRVIVHGDMTATLTENGSTYVYDEPDQPGVDPFTWSAKGESYSLDRVRADLMALDESLLSLAEQIAKALTGTSEQQGATTADLTKAQADLNAALSEATASASEAFASVTKGVSGAVSDTNATFTRVSYETAVSLSRGVTDSQASLADLTMQVSDQAVRSGETLIQATNGLTGAVTQIGNARAENERLFGISNTAVSNSLDEGRDFRDDNFHHAALAAIESIEEVARQEVLNKIQFVLALLGAIPGPIGIGFNLLNAEISKARGNAEAARDYTIYAIPFVGGVYGLGQLGVMLGQYTAYKISQAISAKPDEQTQLPIVHRINWVSGPGGGNSFVAGTGVVTGVDEDGNLITTNIEDLEIGDVVLAGNELDPMDPTSYELVTATSHRTVHELTEVTYVDDQGNIEVIKATDNHEFYVESAGWVKAAALQQGNTLRLADGRTATVTSTTTLDIPEGVEVYNLTVTDGKTYFVDDGQGEVSAAWVHNAGAGLHHFLLRSLGSKLPYKSKDLTTRFAAAAHTKLHKALNIVLRKKTKTIVKPDGTKVKVHMQPIKGNAGSTVQKNFTKYERLVTQARFYKTYQNGKYYKEFIKEARKTIDQGLFK